MKIFNRYSTGNYFFKVIIDLILVICSYIFSYLLRFEFKLSHPDLVIIKNSLPFIIGIKLILFFYFNLYKAIWRYVSIIDIVNLVKAIFVSSLVTSLAILISYRFEGFPRSVFLLDGVFTFLFLVGVRLMIRIYYSSMSPIEFFPFIQHADKGKPLLILGAGQAGEKVVREIKDNPKIDFYPIGFLDDDRSKIGKTLQGIPILGKIEDIANISMDFDEILIAIPSAKGEQMRRIVEACEQTGKKFLTVPGLGEIIDGKVSIKTVRKVTLEDLVGRSEIHLNYDEIESYIKGKKILITGAGGSIGSELVRQIGRFSPKALALVEISEFNLFQVEMECHQRYSYIPINALLVDIKDKENLKRIIRDFSPQVVFHAAAYKHVPIQELHPWEAVTTNIIGTRNLIETSLENGVVERFVFVSTDKAVYPVNVMGATKRVAEMLIQCQTNEFGPRFMAVRFGNVLGSSGSVIPVFQDQISRGGPVTVTHSEVTRYFMSTPEAAQLILQASTIGRGGEIFILDMGKSMRVLDVAKDLIRLHGFEPEKDIPIKFIGLRPGEKLYEELITQGEGIIPSAHNKILILQGKHCNLELLNRSIDELVTIARTYDPAQIKNKLKEIVPEYTPQDLP